MQYLHQSTYGHAGSFHTAKPIMAMQGGHIYDMKEGRPDLDKPLYAIRGGKAYATAFHPGGESPHALLVPCMRCPNIGAELPRPAQQFVELHLGKFCDFNRIKTRKSFSIVIAFIQHGLPRQTCLGTLK